MLSGRGLCDELITRPGVLSTVMCVCCECCVLSGRGLCDELITNPEEVLLTVVRRVCVCVCVSV